MNDSVAPSRLSKALMEGVFGREFGMSYPDFVRFVLESLQKYIAATPNDRAVWSALSATPAITPLELSDMAWVGQSHVPGHRGAVTLSVAFTPGEVRIGVILPRSAVEHEGNDLRDSISMAIGPHKADVIATRPGNFVLFDWHFNETPFGAEWVARSMQSTAHAQILLHRLFFLVQTVWRGVTEVIATAGRFDMAHDLLLTTTDELPVLDILRALPCVIYDTMCDEDAGRWLTILRSSMDEDEMTSALRGMGIEATVRRMMQVTI